MTKQEICALVALAASSNPSMQNKDPQPIVAAWSVMLADLDPLVAKVAVSTVSCLRSRRPDDLRTR